MCASAILRLARTIRLPIVGSLTTKARATSAVRQPPERAQRQRDASGNCQRRMTAREDQPQPVIGDQALLVRRRMLLGVQARQLGEAVCPVRQRARAAQPVDRPPSRGGRDPRARVRRDPVARPRRHGGGEGVLHRVLGELEVADVADQGREDRRALLPERPFDGGGRVVPLHCPPAARVHDAAAACSPVGAGASASTTGRTSTDP